MGETKHIVQKTYNTCGVAALAMAFFTSYDQMRRIMREYKRQKGEKFIGTTDEDDRHIAALFGEKIKIWHINDKNRKKMIAKISHHRAMLTVPRPDQIFIARDPKRFNEIEWHAVYWDGDHLYDPSFAYAGLRYGKDGMRAFSVAIKAAILSDD